MSGAAPPLRVPTKESDDLAIEKRDSKVIALLCLAVPAAAVPSVSYYEEKLVVAQ